MCMETFSSLQTHMFCVLFGTFIQSPIYPIYNHIPFIYRAPWNTMEHLSLNRSLSVGWVLDRLCNRIISVGSTTLSCFCARLCVLSRARVMRTYESRGVLRESGICLPVIFRLQFFSLLFLLTIASHFLPDWHSENNYVTVHKYRVHTITFHIFESVIMVNIWIKILWMYTQH